MASVHQDIDMRSDLLGLALSLIAPALPASGQTGGIGCAVLTALDAQDKERIRNAQIAAAATNQPRYLSYVGSDDRQHQITVRPQPALVGTAEAGGRICRAMDTSATITGAGTADLPQQSVCRTPSGSWVTV